MGFEPTLPVRVNTLSKRAPSATRPSLQRPIRIASAGTADEVPRHEPMALETGFAYFVSGWPEIHMRREIVRLVRPVVLCGGLILVLQHSQLLCICRRSIERNPLGTDAAAPRFAWQSDSSVPNWMQDAYEIRIGTDEQAARNGNGDVWDSGRIPSADSIDVAYRGPALHSHTRYFWTVRVWDKTERRVVCTGVV